MKTINKISEIARALTPSLAANHLKVLSAGMAIAAFAVASPVQAQYTEINIAPQANTDLDTYPPTAGTYPSGGSTLTVAGVPFATAELDNTPNTFGIVQAPSAGPPGSVLSGPFNFSFSVPKGIQASALYCLMDSVWGAGGENVGSVVITGSHGENATLTLTEGVNIRDCHNDGFEDGISDPTVVSTYFANGVTTTSPDAEMRLDRQQLLLPSSFNGDTITTIDFQGTAQGYSGDAFIAGLTLEVVPEPSAWALLALGIAALVIYGVKRSAFTRSFRLRLATARQAGA